jgi:hypothetical protein
MRIRTIRLLAALSLAAAPIVQAADVLVVPTDVAAKQQELLPLIPLTVQPKVASAAKSLAAPIMRGTLTEESATSTVIGTFGEKDIDVVVVLVMMTAAKDADADLKQLLSEMNTLNEQKNKHREYLDALRARRAAMSKQLAADYRGRASLPKIGTTPFLELQYGRYPQLSTVDPSRLTLTEIDQLIADTQATLDSMSEMSELEMLRLQMAMDRTSNFLTILSNAIRKMSEAAAAITQNLKA